MHDLLGCNDPRQHLLQVDDQLADYSNIVMME
jgi:hypothetical protein